MGENFCKSYIYYRDFNLEYIKNYDKWLIKANWKMGKGYEQVFLQKDL